MAEVRVVQSLRWKILNFSILYEALSSDLKNKMNDFDGWKFIDILNLVKKCLVRTRMCVFLSIVRVILLRVQKRHRMHFIQRKQNYCFQDIENKTRVQEKKSQSNRLSKFMYFRFSKSNVFVTETYFYGDDKYITLVCLLLFPVDT